MYFTGTGSSAFSSCSGFASGTFGLYAPSILVNHFPLFTISQYATQPLYSAYMGIYLLWAVMTILSTRVYLNLVFLARKPTLEQTTHDSRAEFSSPSLLDGIRMQIHRTTTVEREIVTFGRTRVTRPGRTFDTVRERSFLCSQAKAEEWSLTGLYSLLNRHLQRIVLLHQTT